MLPDRVSNPGPLTYESGALPIALRGPALKIRVVGVMLKKLYFEMLIVPHALQCVDGCCFAFYRI